jgi:hypothetical protein
MRTWHDPLPLAQRPGYVEGTTRAGFPDVEAPAAIGALVHTTTATDSRELARTVLRRFG